MATSGNVTDDVWKEYIKNQTPPEPEDDFMWCSDSRRPYGWLIRLLAGGVFVSFPVNDTMQK